MGARTEGWLLAVIIFIVVVSSGCIHEEGDSTVPVTGDFHKTSSFDGNEIQLVNMSSFKEKEVREVAGNFYEGLPKNESERLKITAQVADDACSLEKMEKSTFSAASDTKRQAYRVKHAAEMVEENFNQEISPDKIENVINGAGKVGKYVTIVGPYNKFVEDSCDFDKDTPETVEDFYMSSASLGVELALIQYGVYYKGASEVTRMASHSRTFRMVQSKFGDKTLGTLMSETHWATRNTFQGSKQFASEVVREYNLSHEIEINVTRVRLEAKKKYGWVSNKTQEAVDHADLGRRITCLKNSTNWEIAGDVARILSDGKVRETEIQSLPSPVQQDFSSCLK